ncbi:hypothetical protein [Sulfitobacter sp. JB4-11]|uniref:hypothetical protein n=1 Tax=Sulfitobacter rhodophyticola TaxID=3238304 RepID=UPI0035154B5A
MFEVANGWSIRVNKSKSNDPQSIAVCFEENQILFEFYGEEAGKRGSAPLAKWAPNHNWQIMTSEKKYPKNSARQNCFEALVMLLSSLYDGGNVPVGIVDAEGDMWRLDKTCAEWAAETDRFLRVADKDGRHFLRPV